MKQLLTLIIPVYNTEKYIIRCLNTTVNPLVNVIIVNDGSTDNSMELINTFCKTHENYQMINTSNQGAAHARITGLKSVKTKYFMFVDSDDKVNIKNCLKLVKKMEKENIKVGNGRMTVYLPNCFIPFNSRKWKKELLNFSKDKLEFSNLTCSLLDKIWHIDCAPLFMSKTVQIVYEDMEIVYYVIAKQEKLIHTNDLIYQYHMRGLKNNSTSALGLQVTNSMGIQGLLAAANSMNSKFTEDNIYQDFKDELDSIIIKLIYQRIFCILTNKKIQNKKEMATLTFQILNNFLPKWQYNKYFKNNFKKSEYNDLLFYKSTKFLQKLYNINNELSEKKDYQKLLKEYNNIITLK